jgi:hypothetical protein
MEVSRCPRQGTRKGPHERKRVHRCGSMLLVGRCSPEREVVVSREGEGSRCVACSAREWSAGVVSFWVGEEVDVILTMGLPARNHIGSMVPRGDLCGRHCGLRLGELVQQVRKDKDAKTRCSSLSDTVQVVDKGNGGDGDVFHLRVTVTVHPPFRFRRITAHAHSLLILILILILHLVQVYTQTPSPCPQSTSSTASARCSRPSWARTTRRGRSEPSRCVSCRVVSVQMASVFANVSGPSCTSARLPSSSRAMSFSCSLRLAHSE